MHCRINYKNKNRNFCISSRLSRTSGSEFDSRSRRTCRSTALRFGSYVELFFNEKFQANENKLFSIIIFLPATLRLQCAQNLLTSFELICAFERYFQLLNRKQSVNNLKANSRDGRMTYMAALFAQPNFNGNWSVKVRVGEADGVLVPCDL